MALMQLLYDLGLRFYALGIRMAAFFVPKARLWIEGRRGWREKLDAFRKSCEAKPVLWMHVASLGEFEQGRPVLESFRVKNPDWKIVLSFFSPSGYEIRKNYPGADLICYLPLDTRRNARDFLDLLRPDEAIFVKYEFWAHFLAGLKKRRIPTLLVSGLFRPSQPFFKFYGGFWRNILGCFSHFYVQDEASAQLLKSIDFQNVTVAGDTRIDRVLMLAATAPENAGARAFTAPENGIKRPVLVAGSTWAPDEDLIVEALRDSSWKLIIAPHEPSERNVLRLENLFKSNIRYSRLADLNTETSCDCLIIDNIGLLNTLYPYGTVAYIGGGFGKGIHNTLEPAAYGLPVIFGPKYEKFEEARQFVARGGAFPVRNAVELLEVLQRLQDPEVYRNASNAVRNYLEESRGATNKMSAEFGMRSAE